MALVVESVGTGTREAASTDLTITKPASVAVGDLLITVIGVDGGGGATLTTLSGWTLLQNNISGTGIACYWRTATSADVSATDYTWSMSGNTTEMSGVILRISGQPTGSEIASSEIDTASETDTTVTFTTASAPTTSESLIIMGVSGVNNVSLSSYATTPSATFTERADLPLTSFFFGVATAPYTGTTQVTSRVFTTSGNVSGTQYSVLLFVNVIQNASGTTALLSADADFFAPTASSGTSGTTALLSADADFSAPTSKSTSPTQWTPVTKPSTTWTPISK